MIQDVAQRAQVHSYHLSMFLALLCQYCAFDADGAVKSWDCCIMIIMQSVLVTKNSHAHHHTVSAEKVHVLLHRLTQHEQEVNFDIAVGAAVHELKLLRSRAATQQVVTSGPSPL